MTAMTESLRVTKARLTESIAKVRADIDALRSRITDTRRQLERARLNPIPTSELAARARAIVKQTGEQYIAERGSSLLYGSDALCAPDLKGARVPWGSHHAVPWGALCAGEPDRAAAFLVALVERVPYEAGPPSSERPTVITQLERALAEAESAEEQLVDQAAELGVEIGHRADVQQRRATEAERQREADARRTNQQTRQAAIDTAYAKRPRAARSPYLEAQRAERPALIVERPVN